MEEFIDKLLAKINAQPHSAALVALEGLLKSFKKIAMEVEADELATRDAAYAAKDEKAESPKADKDTAAKK